MALVPLKVVEIVQLGAEHRYRATLMVGELCLQADIVESQGEGLRYTRLVASDDDSDPIGRKLTTPAACSKAFGLILQRNGLSKRFSEDFWAWVDKKGNVPPWDYGECESQLLFDILRRFGIHNT